MNKFYTLLLVFGMYSADIASLKKFLIDHVQTAQFMSVVNDHVGKIFTFKVSNNGRAEVYKIGPQKTMLDSQLRLFLFSYHGSFMNVEEGFYYELLNNILIQYKKTNVIEF